jgi:predicted dehydrogenase
MNEPSSRPLRWGILGAANIARKNWNAIRLSGNGEIAAVASRTVERARAFIDACQADAPFPTPPRALAGYEAVIDAADIDAVYIPLPTGVRKEWVMQAAATGKHVLCEKPCASTVEDLEEMIAECRRRNVQFMDGVMFMHGRRLEEMRAVLDDGSTIGQIRRINSVFNFNGPAEFFAGNIRVQGMLEPHGCVGDLGWYNIRFALWAMNWQLPRLVTGRILASVQHPSGGPPVPTEFSGELIFPDGASSGFYCSFVSDLQQTAIIGGTRGFLRLDDFVLPFYGPETAFETFNSDQQELGCDFNMEARRKRWSVAEYSSGHPTAQEVNMFRRFAEQARSGELNDLWPEMALKTQAVMQACLASARSDGAPVGFDTEQG